MAVDHPAGPVQLTREIEAPAFGPLNRAGNLAGGPQQHPELGGLATGMVRKSGEAGPLSPGLLDPLGLRLARGFGVVPRPRSDCGRFPPAGIGGRLTLANLGAVSRSRPGSGGRFSVPVFSVLWCLG